MEECARMSCDKEAVALLTFAPRQAKAWLYDLVEANPTGGIMLCRRHANATVVPMSWQLVDARDPAWPGPNGPVDEPVAEAAPAPATSPGEIASSTLNHGVTLPSDAARDDTFASVGGPLQPEPYAEPRAATLRAAGLLGDFVGVRPAGDADMSLFQLPLADAPAVTPHPER